MQRLRSFGVLRSRYLSTTNGVFYQRTHEYAKVLKEEGDKVEVQVGITDFAQQQLGEVVFVELPDVGTDVTQTEPFGSVESTKAASDVNSPLTGKVSAVNEALLSDASLVNSSPLGNGWFITVALNSSEFNKQKKNLLSETEYKKVCDQEASEK